MANDLKYVAELMRALAGRQTIQAHFFNPTDHPQRVRARFVGKERIR